MSDLAGKSAFVVGGSRGIGAATATRLAADGANVAVSYAHAEDKARAVVDVIEGQGRDGMAVWLDGSDANSVTDAVEQVAVRFGKVDILVNCGGFFPYGLLEDVTLDQFDEAINVHVRTAFLAAQAAVPHMADGGRVINIGSAYVERVPFPGVSLYCLSKAALTGFTKALARELGPRGITVNLVHPGPTDTDMNPADGPDAEGQREITALGHYGSASDIAASIAHLSGEGGRYITGESLAVDGGWAV
ncbi:SDR family NAD(P)-dependent oxidoreductase [Amycolatopsis sp. cmx-4-54]|uniref:SDR family NAD(P)-dependent oxidoreductase n=1 Tax=Amycolatopsis sp. cmx-4-54 TaxID=2790936 RepID=UPI00397D5893